MKDLAVAGSPVRRLRRGLWPDRRGSVSIIFAACLVPMILAAAVAVDFSRVSAARANLQEAVDNGALSGAAAYSVNAAAAQTKAIVMATSSFCEASAAMPAGFAITAGTGSAPCGGSGAAGPTVTTQIGGFQTGTPGVVPSQCSASNPVPGGAVTCGFIVTVTAQAKMTAMIPAFFGATITIAATGIAANPFINIGSAIATQLNGGAYNANSVWVYPLLLNANGDPDYSTNAGAIPGLISGYYPADASASGCSSLTTCGNAGTPAGVNCLSSGTACGTTPPSGCTDSPTQFLCGQFTMLASTYYNNGNCSPCNPLGAGTYPTINAGIIQNPKAPAAIITATTPLGIAFESQGGGTISYGYGSAAGNGCYYPGNAFYVTIAQVYSTAANTFNGSSTAGNQGVDWPKVTHWFYSSYLANGYPPSEGEILSQSQLLTYTSPTGVQTRYNYRFPSLGLNSTNTWSPTLAACAQPAQSGALYDKFLTTAYPASGATNGSLFILQQPSGSAYIQPSATGYAGVLYTPQATPGAQFGALSCQAYGPNIYTFYWNDMSGFGDDLDYNNGTVRISCAAPSLIKLIG